MVPLMKLQRKDFRFFFSRNFKYRKFRQLVAPAFAG